MSKIQKSALALAVAVAFGLPAMASAATIAGPGTPAAPVNVVYYTVDGTTGAVNTGASVYSVSIESGDNLAGRTTGMGVYVTFPAGVKVTAATVAAGTGAGTTAGDAAATLVTGIGTNQLQINVTPDSTDGLKTTGPVFTITGLTLTGATGLASVGGSLSATVKLYDPNSAATLTSATGELIDAVNPIKVVTTADGNTSRIDVGTTTNYDSKTAFSPNGSVANAADVTDFQSGTVAVSLTAGALDATSGLAYAAAVGDTLTTTLAGTFGAFDQTGASVTLSSTVCSAPTVVATGTFNTADTTVTFGYPYAVGSNYVCFNADGTDVIDASGVTASTTFKHGTVTTAAQTGDLQALAYNGPVDVVYTFNPASNTNQQSMLRVSNTGGTSGLVTITAKDDAGNAGAGSVSFNLAAGKSVYLSSGDLENGNTAKGLSGALGAGTGKWILTVTGEISSMEVTNLNRNNSSGTLNNLGTPVSGDH